MYRFFKACFFLLVTSPGLYAQVLPAEDKTVNYRLVGFSIPAVPGTTGYTVEIAPGKLVDEVTFNKNIIKTGQSKNNKIIAEVPAFGAQYTWRMNVKAAGGVTTGGLHYFSTGAPPSVDENNMRLRVIKKAEACKDAYVLLDGNKVMYDMEGKAVWYLPELKIKHTEHGEVHDMKLTADGTITLLVDERAYEINYDGDIVWQAPDDGKVSHDREEHYHHELTRLGNGNYMVLGTEFAAAKAHNKGGNEAPKSANTPFVYQRLLAFGTIIEYNPKGEVVWQWKAAPVFKDMDITFPVKGNGVTENAIHENAFYFDEKGKTLLVSFKNISQVLKIKYPEGKVLNSFGALNKEGVVDWVNGPFCEQHSVKYNGKGNILLFNNNMCAQGSKPKIMVWKEIAGKTGALQPVWEYECAGEVTTEQIPGKENSTSGGNITELPGNMYFASMCSPYANLFIVNNSKKLLWNAAPEKWNAKEEKWGLAAQYRASIIENKTKLEKLIFP